MKSLKKVLCVVLSLAMILGMAAVAFADDELIANLITYGEAVDVITGIKAFVGDAEGNLNLNGTFTREQAAKIVAYLIIGQENADAFEAEEIFEDVDVESWAAGYITFCAQQGIIAGRNETTFAPLDTVTGVEFGKMLVCCLGYDAVLEGLVGSDWDINTEILMAEAGLFDDLFIDVDEALTREEAAQLCFNALKADTVEYDEELVLADVANKALLETIYNDDVLQLGEKLYPTLLLKVGEGEHTWTFDAEKIGTYYDEVFAPVTDEPDEDEFAPYGDREYALIGVKHIINDDSKVGKLVLGPDAEDIVLFSKDGEKWSTLLKAYPGEKIFVKANNFTINLKKIFYNQLPTTLTSNTQLIDVTDDVKKAELEKLIGRAVDVNDTLVTDWFNPVEVIDDVLNQYVVNKLEESEKDLTIELYLDKLSTEREAAVYYFKMPERIVSAYDFEAGYEFDTVTFFNASLFKKTIYVKNGELGEIKKITIKPFSKETLEVCGDEATYFTAFKAVSLFRPLSKVKSTVNRIGWLPLFSLPGSYGSNYVVFR